ncbi:putative dual-specificity kinase [Helianthus anomalus]
MKSLPVMEMERVTEFPMSPLDLRSRKQQRLGWDVAPLMPKILLIFDRFTCRNIRFALSEKELIEEEYQRNVNLIEKCESPKSRKW